MFLPVNMRQFYKQYSNFYCKWCIRSSHSRALLIIVINLRCPEGIPVGRAIRVKLQAVPSVLVDVGFLVDVFQVFYLFFIYCVNGCFSGTALNGCFCILGARFIIILHGRNVFWRAHSACGCLINIFYLSVIY